MSEGDSGRGGKSQAQSVGWGNRHFRLAYLTHPIRDSQPRFAFTVCPSEFSLVPFR